MISKSILVAGLTFAMSFAATAEANETRAVNAGSIAVTADVAASQLENDRHSAQLQITFGTLGVPGKTWANGVTLYCSPTANSIAVNAAGHFGFKLEDFSKVMHPEMSLYTEAKSLEPVEPRSILIDGNSVNVWSGIDKDGLRAIMTDLKNGDAFYFKLDEPKSTVKSITVTMENAEGHNNLSAFRKYCETIWVPIT